MTTETIEWISIGATDLQKWFMAVTRGIAMKGRDDIELGGFEGD